jgi:hypothetical protein
MAMPPKKGTVSRTLQVLTEIRDDIREMKGDIRRLNDSVVGLGQRIDNVLIGPHREDHFDLRRRVERLEAHVGLDPAR